MTHVGNAIVVGAFVVVVAVFRNRALADEERRRLKIDLRRQQVRRLSDDGRAGENVKAAGKSLEKNTTRKIGAGLKGLAGGLLKGTAKVALFVAVGIGLFITVIIVVIRKASGKKKG